MHTSEEPKILSEQERYYASLTPLEQSQFDSLLQKNMKLRGEITEVATQLDALAGRQRAEQFEQLEDHFAREHELGELQLQLDQQEVYLADITLRLHERRKLVDDLMHVSEYQDKENTLVYLKKKIKDFAKEKDALDKIILKQRKDLQMSDVDDAKKERVDSIH